MSIYYFHDFITTSTVNLYTWPAPAAGFKELSASAYVHLDNSTYVVTLQLISGILCNIWMAPTGQPPSLKQSNATEPTTNSPLAITIHKLHDLLFKIAFPKTTKQPSLLSTHCASHKAWPHLHALHYKNIMGPCNYATSAGN